MPDVSAKPVMEDPIAGLLDRIVVDPAMAPNQILLVASLKPEPGESRWRYLERVARASALVHTVGHMCAGGCGVIVDRNGEMCEDCDLNEWDEMDDED